MLFIFVGNFSIFVILFKLGNYGHVKINPYKKFN